MAISLQHTIDTPVAGSAPRSYPKDPGTVDGFYPACDHCGQRKPCVSDRGYYAGDCWIDTEMQCEECASAGSPCPVTCCDECQQAIADGEMEAAR